MTKLTMNLEIMTALKHFNIATEFYNELKFFYGSAENLHSALGAAFENENILNDLIAVTEHPSGQVKIG